MFITLYYAFRNNRIRLAESNFLVISKTNRLLQLTEWNTGYVHDTKRLVQNAPKLFEDNHSQKYFKIFYFGCAPITQPSPPLNLISDMRIMKTSHLMALLPLKQNDEFTEQLLWCPLSSYSRHIKTGS